DDWKIKIDTEIDQTFLTSPRSIEKLYQLREFRIVALQKPSQPKRSVEDSNLPMQTLNNAKPIRNTNRNTNVQITFIVNEYKRTLDVDDKKKFNRIKTDHVKKLIKDAYAK
ncbi:9876_t:CDS:1, partial [Gigaspora margarita]